MSAKDIFLHKRTEELRKWWVGIVHDDRWQQVLLFARSEMLDSEPNDQQLKGAVNFERILTLLPEASDMGSDALYEAAPGLHHNFDKKPIDTQAHD